MRANEPEMGRLIRLVSPLYLLAGAISLPFVRVGFRLRARRESHLELRSLAARAAALPAAAASLHGEERALQPGARADPEGRWRLPGAAWRRGSGGDPPGGRPRPRRRGGRHVPRGDSAEEGPAEEARGPSAQRRGQD